MSNSYNSSNILNYDTILDSNLDVDSKNESIFAFHSIHTNSLITDSYQQAKNLNRFYSSPNIIVLFGDCISDCELLTYPLYLKLTGSNDSSNFFELNENVHWNSNGSYSTVLIPNYKNFYDKLIAISDVILNPGDTQWLFIISNTLSSQLISLIELFPHWLFSIPPYNSTDEENLYIYNIYSTITNSTIDIPHSLLPIFTFHSIKWLNLKKKQKKFNNCLCKSSLLKPKK